MSETKSDNLVYINVSLMNRLQEFVGWGRHGLTGLTHGLSGLTSGLVGSSAFSGAKHLLNLNK